MRTTGQRLNEQQEAIQRMLDWWGELLPALVALERRLDRVAAEVARLGGDPALSEEVDAIRRLLDRAAADARSAAPTDPPTQEGL